MMTSEYSLPIGLREDLGAEVDFGICEQCGDMGVKLLHCRGWVCHRCAYAEQTSERKIGQVDPTH